MPKRSKVKRETNSSANDDCEPIFEVECLINRFYKKASDTKVFEGLTLQNKNKIETWYEIKWLGYNNEENTFEPEDNLVGCTDLLAEFETKRERERTLVEQKFYVEEPMSLGLFDNEGYSSSEYVTTASNSISIPKDHCVYYKSKAILQQIEQNFSAKNRKTFHVFEDEDYTLISLRYDEFNPWLTFSGSSMKSLGSLQDYTYSAVDDEWYSMQDQNMPHYDKWHNSLKHAKKPWPLIENKVDTAGPPPSFKWIEENLFSDAVNCQALMSSFLFSCNGIKCCGAGVNENCDCSLEHGATPAYNEMGRLRSISQEFICECNFRCGCSIVDCPNRVIQRGRRQRLILFRCANGKGWGVKATKFIPKGTFIDEYVGEIISNDEADVRGQANRSQGCTYLFDLDAFIYVGKQQASYVMDANYYGNVTHFLNHSCNPNLRCIPFSAGEQSTELHRLAFFSIRDIKAGEELTFFYGGNNHGFGDYFAAQEGIKVSKKGDSMKEPSDDFFKCLCGEKECQGFISFR